MNIRRSNSLLVMGSQSTEISSVELPMKQLKPTRSLGLEKAVVKAQVHTGGRGKAGGVKLGSNETEIRQHAEAILGMNIKGFTVDRVLVSEAVDIASEYYMSILVDRKSKCPMLMLSRAGGMDIEQVAKEIARED